MTGETPIDRHAARVLLFDGVGRVLLAKYSYDDKRWWCAPGGGLEDGEKHEDAARREVGEETGFELAELGSWVWTREHIFRLEGRLIRQLERYFLAVSPAFDPRPIHLTAEEATAFRGLSWWTLSDLKDSEEEFAPADLPELLSRLVEEGPPEHPIPVGV